MTLLLPRSRSIRVDGWTLVCHEMSLTEIAVQLDVVVQCIQSSFQYVSLVLRQQIFDTDTSNSTGHSRTRAKKAGSKSTKSKPEMSSSVIKTTLERIVLFHPEGPQQVASMTVYLNTSRAKRNCNAAVALTYLRLRDLDKIADKLAIVANMCGYPLRLDTTKLGETQESLGVCMLALSISNGDFSLITPELYRFPTGKADSELRTKARYSRSGPSANRDLAQDLLADDQPESTDFSWNKALCPHLEHVYSKEWNPHGNFAAPGPGCSLSVSRSGLSMVGMVWNMDRFIDLQRLKRKYACSWTSLTKNLSKTPWAIFSLGVTHILFEIIRELVSRGEVEIADTILNSTSNPRWQTKEWGQGIESVRQLPAGLNVENRGGMFSLDQGNDGRYHQCWIIDRVMGKGGFWVGKIVNAVSLPPRNEGSPLDQIDMPAEKRSEPKFRFFSRGHQSRLFIRWMLSEMLSTAANTYAKFESDKDLPIHSYMVRQSDRSAGFAIAMNDRRSPEEINKELEERRAIFDVDGDVDGKCLVFQPYHMILESIPRPELRSMSVSWKVEPVDTMAMGSVEEGKDDETKGRKELKFRSLGGVKGMWRYNISIIGSRVLLV